MDAGTTARVTIDKPNDDIGPIGAEVDEYADTARPRSKDRSEVEDDANRPDSAEPTDEKMYTSEPLETDHGVELIQQQNVGPGNERGGGEWPHPKKPPQPPAPGSAED